MTKKLDVKGISYGGYYPKSNSKKRKRKQIIKNKNFLDVKSKLDRNTLGNVETSSGKVIFIDASSRNRLKSMSGTAYNTVEESAADINFIMHLFAFEELVRINPGSLQPAKTKAENLIRWRKWLLENGFDFFSRLDDFKLSRLAGIAQYLNSLYPSKNINEYLPVSQVEEIEMQSYEGDTEMQRVDDGQFVDDDVDWFDPDDFGEEAVEVETTENDPLLPKDDEIKFEPGESDPLIPNEDPFPDGIRKRPGKGEVEPEGGGGEVEMQPIGEGEGFVEPGEGFPEPGGRGGYRPVNQGERYIDYGIERGAVGEEVEIAVTRSLVGDTFEGMLKGAATGLLETLTQPEFWIFTAVIFAAEGTLMLGKYLLEEEKKKIYDGKEEQIKQLMARMVNLQKSILRENRAWMIKNYKEYKPATGAYNAGNMINGFLAFEDGKFVTLSSLNKLVDSEDIGVNHTFKYPSNLFYTSIDVPTNYTGAAKLFFKGFPGNPKSAIVNKIEKMDYIYLYLVIRYHNKIFKMKTPRSITLKANEQYLRLREKKLEIEQKQMKNFLAQNEAPGWTEALPNFIRDFQHFIHPDDKPYDWYSEAISLDPDINEFFQLYATYIETRTMEMGKQTSMMADNFSFELFRLFSAYMLPKRADSRVVVCQTSPIEMLEGGRSAIRYHPIFHQQFLKDDFNQPILLKEGLERYYGVPRDEKWLIERPKDKQDIFNLITFIATANVQEEVSKKKMLEYSILAAIQSRCQDQMRWAKQNPNIRGRTADAYRLPPAVMFSKILKSPWAQKSIKNLFELEGFEVPDYLIRTNDKFMHGPGMNLYGFENEQLNASFDATRGQHILNKMPEF